MHNKMTKIHIYQQLNLKSKQEQRQSILMAAKVKVTGLRSTNR